MEEVSHAPLELLTAEGVIQHSENQLGCGKKEIPSINSVDLYVSSARNTIDRCILKGFTRINAIRSIVLNLVPEAGRREEEEEEKRSYDLIAISNLPFVQVASCLMPATREKGAGCANS